MIIYQKKNIATFVGAHQQISVLQSILQQRITVTTVSAPPGEVPEAMMIGL